MQTEIDEIIEIANKRIEKYGWKIYPDNVRVYDRYVRLFYQSKQLVETGIAREDDDDMIYGIGIFLINLETIEFHDVSRIEEIDSVVEKLNRL